MEENEKSYYNRNIFIKSINFTIETKNSLFSRRL